MIRFGLNEKHFELLNQIVIRPLKSAGHKIWIFGSRARGDHKQFSDIDLLIDGIPDPLGLSRIREQLENSSLPFKVDLVLEKDLAESYKENIKRDRVLLI